MLSAAAPSVALSSAPCWMICMSATFASVIGGMTPATSQNQALP